MALVIAPSTVLACMGFPTATPDHVVAVAVAAGTGVVVDADKADAAQRR